MQMQIKDDKNSISKASLTELFKLTLGTDFPFSVDSGEKETRQTNAVEQMEISDEEKKKT